MGIVAFDKAREHAPLSEEENPLLFSLKKGDLREKRRQFSLLLSEE